MIWFWIVAGLLTLAALAAVAAAVDPAAAARSGEEEPVAALYRRQLAAIDDELAQGRLLPEQAAAARTETTRRMLAAAEREAAAALRRGAPSRLRGGSAPRSALPGCCRRRRSPSMLPSAHPRQSTSAPSPMPQCRMAKRSCAAAAARIKAHLLQKPGDLKGWTLLGRTLAALSRFPEAREAYAHAIALAPGATRLHAELGEVLVLAARGQGDPGRRGRVRQIADDPRSRFYSAEASLQHGDTAAAKQKLQALLADAPPDAPWRQAVADRLAELAPAAAAAGGGRTRGAVPRPERARRRTPPNR